MERNPEWIEGDLYFDFSQARYATNFDKSGKGHGLSEILKAVDFILEDQNTYYLIEVKNPENSSIPEKDKDKQKKEYLDKLSKGELHNDFCKKLTDSLIFQSLDRGIPTKKIIYAIIVGLSALDDRMLQTMKEDFTRSQKLLLGPKQGWNKPFEALFFNIESWNKTFPQFQIQKIAPKEHL